MNSDELMEMLSTRNYLGNNFFHEVCQSGSLDLLRRMKYFIEEPISEILNTKNYDGQQCIHMIINSESPDAVFMVKILVHLGANINVQEGHGGFTPLHTCVMAKNYQVAEWLCGAPDIDLEAKNYEGLTAYQLAYRKDECQIMEILEKAGADCEPPWSEEIVSSDDEESDDKSDDKSKQLGQKKYHISSDWELLKAKVLSLSPKNN